MGFFEYLKNSKAMAAKIDSALHRYNNETVRKVFPGGRSSATNIAYSLAKILGLDFDACDAATIGVLLDFYTIVYSGAENRNMEHLIVRNLNEHDIGLIHNEEDAYVIIQYCYKSFSESAKQISDEEIAKFKKSVEFLQLRDWWKTMNEPNQLKYIDDLEYGLIPEKPIFVTGATAMTKYFVELKTALGEDIYWERIESVPGEGVYGPIEKYDIVTKPGKQYATLYVSWNGTTEPPNRAPVGFIRKPLHW